jgi:phage shock protein PspC (stress-responsive transcriptional regulator)
MKKTLTVNLNNVVFNIDDDAYDMLQAYLADVEKYLSPDERKEVMADIEARIAELFSERLIKNKNVLNMADVDEIITVLGKPSQYGNDADSDEAADSRTGDRKRARRFYRDPESRILGGVCSGLAAYLDWDITWIRIIFVVLVYFSAGFIIPVYIVVWIVAPEALTAAQRLEMQGEDVTVDAIKSELNNVRNYVQSDTFKSSASSFGVRVGEIIRVFFKVLFGFVGAILGFVGIILLGVLVMALLFLAFEPSFFTGFAPEIMNDWEILSPEKISLLVISLLLIVGCPIFMLIYWAVRIVSGRRTNGNKTTSWVVLILWLAGIFMFYSVGAKTIIKLKQSDFNNLSFVWDEDDDSPRTDEIRTVEAFNALDVSGSFEINLLRGTVNSLHISAPTSIMSKVISKTEGQTLRLYTERLHVNRPIKVTIHVDTLTYINAKGANKIKAEALLPVDNFKLVLTGASVADLQVDVKNEFKIDLTGAVKADVKGRTNRLKADVTGASKLDAYDLTTNAANVSATGASRIEIFVLDSLDAKAYGASKVRYRGTPKKVNKFTHVGSSIEAD